MARSGVQIRVSQLPPEGLRLEQQLSLASLNARMNEGRGNDILFTKPPQIDVRAVPNASGFSVQGSIRAYYDHPCPRCSEDIPRELKLPVNLLYSRIAEEDLDQDADDIGISFFSGDHIDLEGALQEVLILAINPFEFNPDFCIGRQCPSYAAEDKDNVEEVQTLADKLKALGLKS